MNEFNLKHVLTTGTAKDGKGDIWEVQDVKLIGDTRIQWERSVGPIRFYGETDLDGKVMFGECTDLYSAEVEKTTQTFYLGKIAPSDADYYITKGQPAYLHNLVYEIDLNIEDGEIKSINFDKVRG